MRKQERERER
jgi:hypothetical protein